MLSSFFLFPVTIKKKLSRFFFLEPPFFSIEKNGLGRTSSKKLQQPYKRNMTLKLKNFTLWKQLLLFGFGVGLFQQSSETKLKKNKKVKGALRNKANRSSWSFSLLILHYICGRITLIFFRFLVPIVFFDTKHWCCWKKYPSCPPPPQIFSLCSLFLIFSSVNVR